MYDPNYSGITEPSRSSQRRKMSLLDPRDWMTRMSLSTGKDSREQMKKRETAQAAAAAAGPGSGGAAAVFGSDGAPATTQAGVAGAAPEAGAAAGKPMSIDAQLMSATEPAAASAEPAPPAEDGPNVAATGDSLSA